MKVAVETISSHMFSIVFQPCILNRSSSVDIGVAVNVAFLGIPKLDVVGLSAPLLAILDTARGDDQKKVQSEWANCSTITNCGVPYFQTNPDEDCSV